MCHRRTRCPWRRVAYSQPIPRRPARASLSTSSICAPSSRWCVQLRRRTCKLYSQANGRRTRMCTMRHSCSTGCTSTVPSLDFVLGSSLICLLLGVRRASKTHSCCAPAMPASNGENRYIYTHTYFIMSVFYDQPPPKQHTLITLTLVPRHWLHITH